MAGQNDEVGVSISAAIDVTKNSGQLSAQTKSRFVAAVDRLLGAFFDFPATWIDAWSSSVKSSAEIKRDLREHQAGLIKAAITRNDEQEARRLQLRSVAEMRELEQTLNIAAVVGESAKLLSDDTSQDVANDAAADGAAVDDDWLSRFQHYASGASSKDLRHMWARILKSELQRPGAFSASALRFVAEMDRALALRCERLSARRMGDWIYPNEAEQGGEALTDALSLQSAGLLSGVGGLLTNDIRVPETGFVVFGAGETVLRILASSGTQFSLTSYLVTDLGQEIFSLLPPPNDEDNCRMLYDALPKGKIIRVSLLRLGEYLADDRRRIIKDEELFKKT